MAAYLQKLCLPALTFEDKSSFLVTKSQSSHVRPLSDLDTLPLYSPTLL